MKVLAISDAVAEVLFTERIRDHCAGVRLVLSCGDLPFDYLEYIVTMLNVPLLYVLGNHDHVRHRADGTRQEGPAGGLNVDGRVARIADETQRSIRVAGLEGSMFYGGGAHQYTEGQMVGKALALAPRLLRSRLFSRGPLDVLLTHAAPRGIHDGTDPCHRGFRSFRTLVETFQPRYLLHGHVHPSYGYDVAPRILGKTTIVHVYRYVFLEI